MRSGAVTGLTSTSHPDEATWYSDPNPTFTWDPMLGVQGFAYALDQSAGTVPSPGTISLKALDFADRQE